MKYRPDVDGLRAVAVLAVVGYHAFPDAIRGGFVGVDIFFVISGYLISGLIFAALESDQFSITQFYVRRIRRIFPALALVLGACYAAGWFLLFADRFAELGKHIAGGAGFVANYVFWNEVGYFDGAAETKPLLHLWSLGVEEQFYIVWPLLAWLAWKRRVDLLVVTGLVLLGSMYLNLDHSRRDLVGTFYSPWTRFWELMSGGVLALVSVARSASGVVALGRMGFARATRESWARTAMGGLGLALIAGAVFGLDHTRHFPGLWAVLPAGGAVLVIAGGSEAWFNRRLLSARLLVGVGLISYPLYLWHWPLLSFARLMAGETPAAGTRVAAVLVSVLLAFLTYRFVETPIRFGPPRRFVPVALCLAMAAIGAAGFHAYRTDGVIARPINRTDRAMFMRYYASIRKTGIEQAYRLECDFMEIGPDSVKDRIAPGCTEPGNGQTWFLWGDSHAQALSLGITALLPANARLAQVATSHCRPSVVPIDLDVPGGRCQRANDFALEKIRELRPDILILAQIGAHEATDWDALARQVRTLGVKRVVLVGPVPMWLPSLPEVVTSRYWGRNYDRVSYGLVPERLTDDQRLMQRYRTSPHLTYVSIISRVCNAEGCEATVPGSNPPELVAFDAGHLTPRGSTYLATEVLRSVLIPN